MKLLTRIRHIAGDVSDFLFPVTYNPINMQAQLGQYRIGLGAPVTKTEYDYFYKLYIKQLKHEAKLFWEKQDIELEFNSETCQ